MPLSHLSQNLSSRLSASTRRSLTLTLAGTLAAVALAGCGLGTQATSSSDLAGATINGKTFGGPNPIIGATVKLYTTGDSSGNSTGYGVATMREEANPVNNGANYPSGDTDVYGNFSFAPGYTCPAGQFAYIVSAGGNTGASATASGATATGGFNGVSGTSVQSGGSAYTTAPTVTITNASGDTTGSGATATATITTGAVTRVTITNTGTNYTAPPIITFSGGGGSGAAATTTIASGAIAGINVINQGANYDAATVTITSSDGLGSGATATATVTNGAVTAIKLTSAGTGYDANPIVTINNGVNGVYNPANNNAVLVAALGRCEDLYANTNGGAYSGSAIDINELTTIATAYALGHFTTVTGTGAATVVSIGSDANNNAAKVGGVSTGTKTAAAGLAHAFLNAANLVNVFADPTKGTGANLTVTPAYSTYLILYAGGTPIVPQTLLNTLGNVLVSCVNSSGGVATSASANDGSACGKIFSSTTIGANIPSNTLSAMMNLAINPTLSGSTSSVTALYNVAGAFTSVYQPALTTAPNDFSVAIRYPGSSSTPSAALGTSTINNSACPAASSSPCQGIIFPTSLALDANDTLYLGNQSVVLTGGAGTLVNVLALSSNGKLLGMTPNNNTLLAAYGLSVDAIGNGYLGGGPNSPTAGLLPFTTGGGTSLAFGNQPATTANVYITATDLANNVWVFGPGTGSTLFSSPAGGQTLTAQATPLAAVNTTPGYLGLGVDPDQNIWTAASSLASGGTGNVSVLQNTGSVAAPAYSSAGTLSYTGGGSPENGISFGPGTTTPYVTNVTSYKTGSPGVLQFAPTVAGTSGATVTALNPGVVQVGTASKLTGSIYNATDGAGLVWAADANSGTLGMFAPATNTSYKLIPCGYQAPSTTTTCFVTFGTSLKPDVVAVDSTGSVWVSAQGNGTSAGGELIQIIGSATPAWPLLSAGKVGQP